MIAACDFLSGQTAEMEKEIEDEMKKAAAAENFEKAATYRDALENIRQTTQKTKKFPRMPYSLPICHSTGAGRGRNWARRWNLPAQPTRIEGFDISNISGTFAVASLVSFRDGRPDRSNYRRFRIKTVTGQDDFACMAETIQRRYSRLQRESSSMPDLILIDGGKGQLNAACAELEKLGLNKIPIIGLAESTRKFINRAKATPCGSAMIPAL